MNNAEIADKLDGMECQDIHVKIQDDTLTVHDKSGCFGDDQISMLVTDFLALCRAVVEKIDGIKAGMVEEAASCAGMGTTKEELTRRQNEM